MKHCWVDHGSNQVVHDWANKKKQFQAGKRGMEGGKGLALFHRKRTKEISFP